MPVGPEVTQEIDKAWLNYAFEEIDIKLKSTKWVSENRIESVDGKTQSWRFLLARAGVSRSTLAELTEAYKKVGWTEALTEVVEESGRPSTVSVILKFVENKE